jgi:hypothetical protein
MPNNSPSIDSKVWNYPPSPFGLRRAGVHVLKNAGVGFGDYVERITYLLFLKLAPPWSRSTGLGQAGPEVPELGLDHS